MSDNALLDRARDIALDRARDFGLKKGDRIEVEREIGGYLIRLAFSKKPVKIAWYLPDTYLKKVQQ